MQLLRIVSATFEPAPKIEREWSLQFGEIEISTLRVNIDNDKQWKTLLVAKTNVELPEISEDNLVYVPESKRRDLEFCLETITNVISVFGRCKRTLSSAKPCLALVPENKRELAMLDSSDGIYCKPKTVASAHGVNGLDSELLSHLQDRFHAVALMAEAHSHSLSAGKFHEYVRLFESAFALQFSQLAKKLNQFLYPRYGYTTEEIKEWTTIRDPLTHADGKKSSEIYLDSDVQKYIQRIEQAAYDVLFNKKDWHKNSRERRDIWKPIAATTSSSGDLVIVQGSEPTLQFQMFDEFGVYPFDLNAVITKPPEEWWYKMVNPSAS
jgi:hypothetical protein